MENLKLEIKQLIIDTLNLEGVSVDDIESDAPLFNEGLGLDSIDALELGLAIKKKFNITLDGESEEMRNNFYSVTTIAKFISDNK